MRLRGVKYQKVKDFEYLIKTYKLEHLIIQEISPSFKTAILTIYGGKERDKLVGHYYRLTSKKERKSGLAKD